MDDTFEFLTKIYSELTAFRKETNTKFERVESRLDKIESKQAKIEVTIEHDIKNSLQLLHEGVAVNTSKLNEHTERLNIIENKVDYIAMSVTSQDKRLKVVESSGKKAK